MAMTMMIRLARLRAVGQAGAVQVVLAEGLAVLPAAKQAHQLGEPSLQRLGPLLAAADFPARPQPPVGFLALLAQQSGQQAASR